VILKCSHCHLAIRRQQRMVEVTRGLLVDAEIDLGRPVAHIGGRWTSEFYHPKCPLVPTKAGALEDRS
jgi:hypothetical protein